MSCPKDKILNTLTNRCILKKNSVQFNKHIKQKLLLKCIDNNKYRSPITARCIYKSKRSKTKSTKKSPKKSPKKSTKKSPKKSTKKSAKRSKVSKTKSAKRSKVSKTKSHKRSKKKSPKAKRSKVSKTKSTKKSAKRSKVSKTKSTKKSAKRSKVYKTKSTKTKSTNKLDKTKYYGYIMPTSGKLRHEINISQGFDISETIRTDFNYWTLQTISNTFFVTFPLAKRLTNDAIDDDKRPEESIHYSPAQNAKLKTYISIKKALPIIQLIDTDYDYWTLSKLCIKFNISVGLAFILRIECFNMQYDRKKLNNQSRN